MMDWKFLSNQQPRKRNAEQDAKKAEYESGTMANKRDGTLDATTLRPGNRLLRVMMMVAVMTGSSAFTSGKDPELSVHFIDVGGDATLFHVGDAAVLIDAGTESRGPMVLDYIRKLGIEDFDLMIGSHPHQDHIGGLTTILRNMPVAKVLQTGKALGNMYDYGKKVAADFQKAVEDSDAEVVLARAGQHYDVGPLSIDILHPAEETLERHTINNSSIVCRITFGEIRFMMTGDAGDVGYGAEPEILRRYYDPDSDDPLAALRADILKVSQHGGDWGITDPFLAAVSPEVAVIPVGKGKPLRHPSQAILDRLRSAGVETYRGGLHGHVVITTDGHTYSIKTERVPDPDKIFRMALPEDRE